MGLIPSQNVLSTLNTNFKMLQYCFLLAAVIAPVLVLALKLDYKFPDTRDCTCLCDTHYVVNYVVSV